MIRSVLSGATAATMLVFACPAFADSPLEFMRAKAEKEARVEKAEAAPKVEINTAAEPVKASVTATPVSEGRASISAAPSPAKAAAKADGTGTGLHALASKHAREHGVPLDLAHGVIMVESRYRAQATGPGGYIGLMQLSYRTAQGMGFKGSRAALYEPSTNLHYGMRYLGEAYRKAGGDYCGAVSKYQGGHGVRGITKAGRVYCGKVKNFIARGVPLKGGVEVAENEQPKS